MSNIVTQGSRTRNFLRILVRSAWTYRALFPLMELMNVREQTRAYKIWVRYLLWMMRSSCSRRKKVIWMSAFAPVELAYAADAVPLLPEILAALVSYLGWAPRLMATGNSLISTDVCSFYRCALGMAAEGFLPEPDVIISSSYLCDGANKFFSYLAKRYGCPHFLLDPPYHGDNDAKIYVKDQLDDILKGMAEALGRKISAEKISEVIRASNEARNWLSKINTLRKAIPAPFPGSEGLSYLAGMGFVSPGSEWAVRFFSSLACDIQTRVKAGKGYLPNEKRRVIWLHHIRPYYENNIFEILSGLGIAVCFEEANYLYWPPLDPSRPIESLAEKVLSNVWRGPLQRRVAAVRSMVKDYQADGVIHFSHWGCRQSCGGAGIIGDVLKDDSIPYMILYGDGADPDNYFPGQTRTRLQAFAELLSK